MNVFKYSLIVFVLVLGSQAKAGSEFVVSDGILAVDAHALREIGINILDNDGQEVHRVIEFREGLTINHGGDQSVNVTGSMGDLSVFDANGDGSIDEDDAPWDLMYLSIDYNKDGVIGKGEYALIGECGVNGINLELADGQAWSRHGFLSRKEVRFYDAL